MDIRSISILVSRLSRPMVQRKNETKTKWQRHKYQILPSSSSFFSFFFLSTRCFRRDKKLSRRIFHGAGRGWEAVAIIVITITPVINDSEDSSFDCYALYLIIPWRGERGLSRMTAKSGVRRRHPSILLAALLNVFQVFSCAQQSCPTIGGLPAALCPDN